MGGQRETTTPQTIQTQGQTHTVGTIRYHEHNGQIHFHDDQNKLKVTIAAAQWLQTYQEMEANLPARKQIIDPHNKTVLHIHLKLTPKKPKKNITPTLTTHLSIHPANIDPEYTKLQKFTYGK